MVFLGMFVHLPRFGVEESILRMGTDKPKQSDGKTRRQFESFWKNVKTSSTKMMDELGRNIDSLQHSTEKGLRNMRNKQNLPAGGGVVCPPQAFGNEQHPAGQQANGWQQPYQNGYLTQQHSYGHPQQGLQHLYQQPSYQQKLQSGHQQQNADPQYQQGPQQQFQQQHQQSHNNAGFQDRDFHSQHHQRGPSVEKQPITPPQRPAKPNSSSRIHSNSQGSYSPMRDQITRGQTVAWHPPPDQGYKTSKLRKEIAEKYGLHQQTVQIALDFADTEEYADLYCLAHCLIGGVMRDAFHQAAMHSFSKDKLLESFGDPERGLKNMELTPEQQKIKSHVLETIHDAEQAELDDADDIEEEESERLKEEIADMSLEDALTHLGLEGPGFGLRDIQRTLFPGNGISTRSAKENALMTARYNVAMEVFDEKSS